MTESNRSTAFLILTGLLFLFSIFSIFFSVDSIIKDIVYAIGFLIAIIILVYFIKSEKRKKKK